MNNETKTHLIADESLGGIMREYVETDRKADVGDYVVGVYYDDYHKETDCYEVGKIYEITEIVVDDMYYVNDTFPGTNGQLWLDEEEFVTLEPTDIVVIDEEGNGKRYRLVDRRAEVGEKVVITERKYDTFGRVFTVSEIDEDADLAFKESDDYYAEHGTYSVLVPVEESAKWRDVRREPSPTLDELLAQVTPDNRHIFTTPYDDDSDYSEYNDCITADETEASPSVIEMLANLAQRIVALEKQTEDSAMRIVDLEQDKAGMLDEIDTLSSTQKRITEDLGWHEMGPGRIANLRNSMSDVKHNIREIEEAIEQQRHEDDRWAGIVNDEIAGLNREVGRFKRISDSEMSARATQTDRYLTIKGEIDTLHSNQKRMGEELANATAPTASDESEVIVELTKMLVDVYRKGSRA